MVFEPRTYRRARADVVASALGNRVHSASDVHRAIDAVKGIPGVLGAVVVCGDTLGAWSEARLVALAGAGATPAAEGTRKK